MRAWWSGTSLVVERGVVEQVRSKTFRIVMALLLLLAIGIVTVPQLIGNRPTSYTLATVGSVPNDVKATIDAAAKASSFQVHYVTRAAETSVADAVRNGDATVGLVDDHLYAAEREVGVFPAVVAQAVVAERTTQLLTQFGLDASQVSQLQSVRPPKQVPVRSVEDSGRAGVGFGVGLVLYLALMFSGTVISTTVATEKSSRISEVLLAVLRPSQVLVGTVLAVGIVTILELLVLGVPIAVAATVTDASWLPSVATGDIALAVMWFALGFALFGFLYAAGGALVEKVTDAGTAVMPVTTLIIAGYILGIVMATSSPGQVWAVLVSMFPLTAPLTMPIRWATGEVPIWQLLVAVVLTAGTAVALVGLGSTIYRRALVITGRRVRLRELFRRPDRS